MAAVGEDAAAACCGICCLCGFSALASWCNGNAYGARGGRTAGCCGPCCSKSFNEDSMDKWEKDLVKLRTEPGGATEQPVPSQPMTVPSSTPPASTHPPAAAPASDAN
ncbi:hypothetical protein GGX14DRAFT_442251 [Mycena pura]|uniref:Uncharacterized protein n=1 Tax=Mycena pura TaxID=153505 RepID=A0AAD6VLN4_9AGAR|nr:hypothetical protein GGX14DRAFT_442251 [Mycena pura]